MFFRILVNFYATSTLCLWIQILLIQFHAKNWTFSAFRAWERNRNWNFWPKYLPLKKNERNFRIYLLYGQATLINAQKNFRSQWVLTTCATAFKKEGCKFENDYFPLMYLASIRAHYNTSADPWSVDNKVFQIFFGYTFSCFLILTYYLSPSLYLDCINFEIAKSIFSQEKKVMPDKVKPASIWKTSLFSQA